MLKHSVGLFHNLPEGLYLYLEKNKTSDNLFRNKKLEIENNLKI